jgi:hypothetical protein
LAKHTSTPPPISVRTRLFRAVHLVSPLGFFSVLQVSPMLIRLLSIDTIY